MWPVVFTFLRSNAARWIVFPAALVIGTVGYTLESFISTKYTPFQPSIQDQRMERLTSYEALNAATDVRKMSYENVLDKNLGESLRKK